jgi:uncharacterized protein (TIGR00251 family)
VSAATNPIRLKLKVVPGASRTEIVGWLGNALKIRVSAAPEKGKANAAVEATIAAALGISPSSVKIIAGKSSARKTIEICGMTSEQIQQRIRSKESEYFDSEN